MPGPTEHSYIDDASALADYTDALGRSDDVALDTEFLRERTYYPKLCLIQLATESGTALVDPLALTSLKPLMDVLYAPKPIKVLHAAAQDLEIFVQITGGTPPALFDTQIAAAFLGFPDQIGYGSLVEKVLGVALDKKQTRSDWTRRPLSADQIGYAIDDVHHLRTLYPLLRERLETADRLSWALEDMARLEAPERYRVDPATAWRKIKGAQRLPTDAFARLKRLARWREEEAQRRDLPRGWVIPNSALLTMAIQQPQNRSDLLAINGVGEGVFKRSGEALLEIIAAPGDESGAGNSGDAPLSESERALLKRLAERVAQRAGELGLSPALIAPRADLESIVRGGGDVHVLEGWRREIVGLELLALRDGE